MSTPTAALRFALALTLAAVGCDVRAEITKPAPRLVDPNSAAIHAAVRSNEAVALKLHGVLCEQPGNLFYSPISVEAVLGMLYAGAEGDTAAQLAELLDVAGDPRTLHEGLGSLLADLAGQRSDRGYTLSVANRLWARPGLDSSEGFVEITRDLYGAPTQAADFGQPERVRDEINRWVDAETAGKIPELLASGQLTKDTVMTVVNAIYFEAEWAKAFDPDMTRPGTFRRADMKDVTVQMMTTPKTALRRAQIEQADWIELRYRGGAISFLACLPGTLAAAPGESSPKLDDIEAGLDAAALADVMSGLEYVEDQIVQMPRFSLRSRLDLIPILQALGVVDLFDPARANLKKIDPNLLLFVAPFVHEATVQVDEHGTVAVAATAGGVMRLSATLPIRFDHPFLFFIRDNLTGAILFAGRVADPTVE